MRQPEFLSDHDQPEFRIRCPVHGFIRFSRNERRLIDHRLFARLRDIKQLGLTYLAYPGATHTRFEHSLGVMDVATQAFDRLSAKHGDLLESTFRTVSGWGDRPLARARQYLRIAALLHDIGHVCFSHAGEEAFGESHEKLTQEIVRESNRLGGVLNTAFGDGCAYWVALILLGGRDLPPQLGVLHDIVSGEMDADRIDYLLRDSLHCGVDYGRFDYRRLIESLELYEEEGALEIALHRDGLHAYEAMILARYQMNTQVYYHKIRRIYDLYMQRYLKARGVSRSDALDCTDSTAMAWILRDSEESEGEQAEMARRIRDRHHHRVVFDTGPDADARRLRSANEAVQRLRKAYEGREFLLDEAKASIHKLFVPGDQDDPGVMLRLIDATGKPDTVGERSQVLRYIPKRFQCARIFADVDPSDQSLRRDMQRIAQGEAGKGV